MSIYQYTNNRMGIYSTANWHISQLTDAPIIQTYKPYDYEKPLPAGVQYWGIQADWGYLENASFRNIPPNGKDKPSPLYLSFFLSVHYRYKFAFPARW